jgi:hypothetical protein
MVEHVGSAAVVALKWNRRELPRWHQSQRAVACGAKRAIRGRANGLAFTCKRITGSDASQGGGRECACQVQRGVIHAPFQGESASWSGSRKGVVVRRTRRAKRAGTDPVVAWARQQPKEQQCGRRAAASIVEGGAVKGMPPPWKEPHVRDGREVARVEEEPGTERSVVGGASDAEGRPLGREEPLPRYPGTSSLSEERPRVSWKTVRWWSESAT